MELRWTRKAKKDLKALDAPVRKRIVRKLEWFANNFEHFTPQPLSGEFKEAYKFRIGDWRVIYTIQSSRIIVKYVGHRRDIYDV